MLHLPSLFAIFNNNYNTYTETQIIVQHMYLTENNYHYPLCLWTTLKNDDLPKVLQLVLLSLAFFFSFPFMTIDVPSCCRSSIFSSLWKQRVRTSDMESSELRASNATTWKMEKAESSQCMYCLLLATPKNRWYKWYACSTHIFESVICTCKGKI